MGEAQEYTGPYTTPLGLAGLVGSVVRVGDGRGFLVTEERQVGGAESYVITAAHCLPRLPEGHLGRYPAEVTFRRLISPLGAEPSVTAACVFVDPIADIAMLGPPEGAGLYDESDQYETFFSTLPPFDIAAPPPRGRIRVPTAPPVFPLDGEVSFPGHVMSIDGQWVGCNVRSLGGPLLIEPEELAEAGMSGSPLVSATGAALGVISTNNWAAVLTYGLPGWLLRALACAS
jgi:trypsin-like peptidase